MQGEADKSTKTRCADVLVDCLIGEGVDTVFGLPGAQTYALFDALRRRQGDIRTYCSRHEQGAGYMAFGYAKSTGRAGVYCVVPGPGLLNSTAALCSAHSAPVMCLTGEVPRNFIGSGHGELHELPDQLSTLRTLTKWADRINYAAETQSVMTYAFEKLRTGRQRPVAVEVPADVFSLRASYDSTRRATVPEPLDPDPDRIDDAVRAIRSARHPMIMVGSGAVEAGEEIEELARMIQAPVVSFRGGRGIVSDESPYGFSCASGYRLWDRTDLVIGIGSRLELPAARWQSDPIEGHLVRIDIDPTQMQRLRPNVPIIADAKKATRQLVDALSSDHDAPSNREDEFRAIKEATWQDIQQVQPQMGYLGVIRDVLPRDGFLVEEICQAGFTAWFGFPIYQPRRLVTSGYQGNLGHGFQTSLGVKLANPDSAVVSICGDGGFMFGVQELATAVQYSIPVIVVLFNNNAFGNVRRDQLRLFDNPWGSELQNPDFVKLAESFGARSWRADSPDALRPILEKALAEPGPTLIEIPIEPGSEASPWPYLVPAGFG
jgi:acetolactate synthase-1/2/3 large subunit